jgi:hypothetical protein
VSAGIGRARNYTLGILVAQRVAQPAPVTAAELTALRSELEDRFEEHLKGVTAVDDPQGWTAEDGLEQYAIQIAVDFLMERLHQAIDDGPARPEGEVP